MRPLLWPLAGLAGCVFAACDFSPGVANADATTAEALGDTSIGEGSLKLVQQVASFSGSATQLSAILVPPMSGHVLVIIGAANNGGLTSVTGGGVATWTKAAGSYVNANLEIWFGTTDGSSSTVTINFTAASKMWMVASEWAGLEPVATLDVAHAAAGTTSPASAGLVTTTHAHDLVMFAIAEDLPSVTFGTPSDGPWTPMVGVTPGMGITQAEWYRVVSTTGTFGSAVSETGHKWDAAFAAFRIEP